MPMKITVVLFKINVLHPRRVTVLFFFFTNEMYQRNKQKVRCTDINNTLSRTTYVLLCRTNRHPGNLRFIHSFKSGILLPTPIPNTHPSDDKLEHRIGFLCNIFRRSRHSVSGCLRLVKLHLRTSF